MTFFEGENCAKMCREATHVINVPAAPARLFRRLRLPIQPETGTMSLHVRNRRLIRLLKRVRKAQALIDNNRAVPVKELAAKMGFSTGHFMKTLQLNYLAPDIIASILDGTQPNQLTARQLIDATLPLDWALQRKMFGFPEQPLLRTNERY